MSRRPRLVVLGIVAALLTAAAPTALAATVPAAAVTGLVVEGAWGSPLLGTGASVAQADTAVSFTTTGESVTLAAAGTTVSLTARTGTALAPGRFTVARTATTTAVGLAASTPSGTCTSLAGSVVVHEVRRSGTAIVGIAATWSARCNGNAVPNVGELRHASTVDYVRFGQVTLGTVSGPQTVTVTSAQQLDFAGIGWNGDAYAFTERGNTCGATVGGGTSCTLTVAARPGTRGGHMVSLTVKGTVPGTSTQVVIGTVSLTTSGVETAAGSFSSIPSARVLDTRYANGIPTKTPLAAATEYQVQVGGRGGVPATGVMAVVLNVTVVKPVSNGNILVWPTGAARPLASTINYPAGGTGANATTVKLGTDGTVSIWLNGGSSHVLLDVTGYYLSDAVAPSTSGAYGSYVPVDPTRIVDTRDPAWGAKKVGPWSSVRVGADVGTALNPHVRGVAVTITVASPTRNGHVTVWNGNPATPPAETSILNFTAGRTVSNMALVPVSMCASACGSTSAIPSIGVLNGSSGSTHIIVDIVGVYDDNASGEFGGRLTPISPLRVVDTRYGTGMSTIPANRDRSAVLPEALRDQWTMGMVANLTAVKPAATATLTIWDWYSDLPGVRSLTVAAGATVATMTMPEITGAGIFGVYNTSAGSTNVIVDVGGTFELYSYPLVSGSGTIDGTPVRTTGRGATSSDRLGSPGGRSALSRWDPPSVRSTGRVVPAAG